jgi:hypothetical protein
VEPRVSTWMLMGGEIESGEGKVLNEKQKNEKIKILNTVCVIFMNLTIMEKSLDSYKFMFQFLSANFGRN